ncbi:MAG: response regulator [Candidatus Limivivens sp.]|nr:response regulator [Candidatus Limivivens sp.]
MDDEKNIREGIFHMLSWEDYGIRIAGMAEDGEEALRQVREYHPEILITDIRMPKMDGLALIEQILKEKESCRIIVLSGYHDFELVRQAMKLGVADYLLKPSSPEEMAKAIEEILDNLTDQIISRYDNREHFELLKNNVMNRIINQGISSRELRSRLSLLGMDFDGFCFTVAVLVPVLKEEELKRHEREFAVFEICEEMLEETGKGVVFTDHQSRTVIFFRKKETPKEFEEEKKVLYECIRKINEELQMQTSVSVGTFCSSYRQLAKSYEEAVKTLEYRYVFGNNVVLLCTEIKEYFTNVGRGVDLDFQRLSDCLRSGSFQEWENYVNAIFQNYTEGIQIYDPYAIRNASLEILFHVFERFENYPIRDRNRILNMKYEALNQIAEETTINGMKNILLATGESLLVEKTYSFWVKKVLEAVELHYNDCNLSLAYLAEQFQVNAAYLGRLFKKEYQCSFNDYLNLYRVEKAKELLRSTVCKGMEICEMVGFVNYNYFYVIFKKITGKNPSDYRKEESKTDRGILWESDSKKHVIRN